jgi:hypothetical protein
MSEFNSCNDDPQAERESLPSSFNYNKSSQETTSHSLDGRKEKRQPSITPRKFNRFFTPRSHGRIPMKLPRGALEDITAPANNRNGTQSSPIRPFSHIKGVEISPMTFTREMKRRKLLHTLSPSPDDSSPEKQSFFYQRPVFKDSFSDDHKQLHSSQRSAAAEESRGGPRKPHLSRSTTTKQIKQLETRGLAGRLLELSFRSGAASKCQNLSYPDNG